MMKSTEFARRRRHLMREMGEDAIAVLPAAPECIRNRDVTYPYRQDSDFLYLCGFPEPEAVLVLVPVPARPQGEYILFCREKDDEKETWHGRRYGQNGALAFFNADDSFPIEDMDDILPGLMENKSKVYYTMGKYPEFDKRMLDWLKQLKTGLRGIRTPNEFVSLDYILHEARLFKSPAEIGAMRKAAKISAVAHQRAMQACRPGIWEYQLEAEILYEFHKNGAVAAYPSIVGGGANACVLHYTDNNAVLREGDLVLMDAGAEYEGYAADVSRTFPVSGCFNPQQREIYQLVLAAQQAAIAKTLAGNHWNDPHAAAVDVLVRGMIDIGLLKGKRSQLIKEGAHRRFYMHRTGHWLGLDVHDVGDYKLYGEWRLLEPGMVTTVEPGLYIKPGKDIPKAYHNIGIRIEDDVLVTKQGNEILSIDAPKMVDEIENIAANMKLQTAEA